MLTEFYALQAGGINLVKDQFSPISTRQGSQEVLVCIRQHIVKQMNADVVLLVVLQQ